MAYNIKTFLRFSFWIKKDINTEKKIITQVHAAPKTHPIGVHGA
jgi:hypothetical protein